MLKLPNQNQKLHSRILMRRNTSGARRQYMWFPGIGASRASSEKCSNLNLFKRLGVTTLPTVSTKVFPRQMRCPPRNGVKLKGFLLEPLGVKNRGLDGSKRSGKNLSGSIHSFSFLHRKHIAMVIMSPFRISRPPAVIFSVTHAEELSMTGGYKRSVSLKQ